MHCWCLLLSPVHLSCVACLVYLVPSGVTTRHNELKGKQLQIEAALMAGMMCSWDGLMQKVMIPPHVNFTCDEHEPTRLHVKHRLATRSFGLVHPCSC